MEKLKLVESFSELRAGSLVVVKNCEFPEHQDAVDHRGILVTFHRLAQGVAPNGVSSIEPSWEMSPRASCCEHGERYFICPSTVSKREVYLVDVGLESSTDTATAEPAPRKKARAI